MYSSIKKNELEFLYSIALKLSSFNNKSNATSVLSLEIEKLFDKFTLHLNSLIRTLPSDENDLSNYDITLWASLGRMIIDTHRLISYLIGNDITNNKPEELEYRITHYNLHYAKRSRSVLKNYGFSDNDELCWLYELSEISLTDKLLEYPNKEKKQLGNHVYDDVYSKNKKCQEPFDNLNEKANFGQATYDLLSNFIHSFPLGIMMYQNKSAASKSFLNFQNTLLIIFEATTIYSASLILNYSENQSKFKKQLTKDEYKHLRKLHSSETIKDLIEKSKNNKFYKL